MRAALRPPCATGTFISWTRHPELNTSRSVLQCPDPRFQTEFVAAYHRAKLARPLAVPRVVTVVLVGHRASGKSTLLGAVATLLGRPAVDLDLELTQRSGRTLRTWVETDEASFREAERACFESLPQGMVVAVGGGFLHHHPQALRHALAVLVPVSFETFAERLRADTKRPRLKPEMSLEEEILAVWDEREAAHQRIPTTPLAEFVAMAENGSRPLAIVTLPPKAQPVEFAKRAAAAGADALEIRTDLTSVDTKLDEAARHIRLIISERGTAAPSHWTRLAYLVDRCLPVPSSLVSWHAEHAMEPTAAAALWAATPGNYQLKHVEPASEPASRLLRTQVTLVAAHGRDRVTVLATGATALPFRALLAQGNALDYLALDTTWSAAQGQRLLSDALREFRQPPTPGLRLGILGSGIAHSKSPSIHRQPFDRIDLPAETDLRALLSALHPHYAGFAVTNPFKKAVALAVGSSAPAVNTIARRAGGWEATNTDVEGAARALAKFAESRVTVLGDGGVGAALRTAAGTAYHLTFVRFAEAATIDGAAVWTWPATLAPPSRLRFSGGRVAIIAYGKPGATIAREIRARGGTPVRVGVQWFIAQARAQREFWSRATG